MEAWEKSFHCDIFSIMTKHHQTQKLVQVGFDRSYISVEKEQMPILTKDSNQQPLARQRGIVSTHPVKWNSLGKEPAGKTCDAFTRLFHSASETEKTNKGINQAGTNLWPWRLHSSGPSPSGFQESLKRHNGPLLYYNCAPLLTVACTLNQRRSSLRAPCSSPASGRRSELHSVQIERAMRREKRNEGSRG
ncbi:hypothetical protein RRG08_024356 [Elysia crispata]|uniref:Uncharacterized protein n=1 Tax=Elysia crispata TaxID=231223 RepID=A0AAE0ZLC6_9GAST|nr:hypothetical protein RRG08_024356 [Elysia crispata]